MREIKFRGWDATGQKKWVYGDLVHNKKVTPTGLEDRVMVGGYEVIPESVGQFTGMRDRNGREIYEGDLFSLKKFNICVTFDEERCRYCLRMRSDEYWELSLDGSFCRRYRVIGTIYDTDY